MQNNKYMQLKTAVMKNSYRSNNTLFIFADFYTEIAEFEDRFDRYMHIWMWTKFDRPIKMRILLRIFRVFVQAVVCLTMHNTHTESIQEVHLKRKTFQSNSVATLFHCHESKFGHMCVNAYFWLMFIVHLFICSYIDKLHILKPIVLNCIEIDIQLLGW